jgi:tetratricopeptide (TPR) repeat protein
VAYSNAAVEDPGLLFPFAAQLPDNDPSKSFFLSTCGVFFLHRFRVARDEEDLDNSITAFEQASQCPLSAAAEGLDYLREAGNAFKARYDLKRNLSDLNRAIEIYEGLVGSTDSNANIHPWLNSPTTSLTRRFERTPPQLIDRSTTIPIQQNALRTTSKEDETLSTLLTDLADLLQDRFRRTRDVNDTTKEISLRQKALRLTPESDPGMPAYLNNLGSAYVDRFNVAGNMTDIYDSIPMYQKSRHLMPEGHPNKPALLDHLANAYGALYEHTGDLNDISEALSAHQNAVDLTPEGAPDMHERLHWMGTSFRLRFEKTEDLNDISQAIAAHRRAVSLVPKGDKQHHVVLEGLGMSLVSSFQQTRDLSELSEAVSTARQAVLLTPEGDKNMYTVLNLLASALLTRFQQTKDLDDSSDAISVYEKLIGLIPEGHPHMPAVLLNQGRSLLDHIVHTRDITEVGTAVSKMRLAATSSTGSPSLRLAAARFWATFSQSVDPAEALNAWTTIIQLLSQVVGMEQTIQKRHQNLVEFSELPTSAAAAAFSLGHPDMVLEWLEQGRCLIWNQLNNLRTPLDDLHAHDPALADHFSKVSSALENAGSRAESSSIRGEGSTMAQLQEDANAHIKLAQQRDRLLENIRGIPGFSNFLRPPQCSNLLSDLPEEGPVVVINVHKDRCDALALIAGADTPLHIPLSNFYTQVEKHQRGMYRYLSAHGVRSRGSQPEFDEESSVRAGGLVVFGPRNVLGDILRELWLLVVKPILDALAISVSSEILNP